MSDKIPFIDCQGLAGAWTLGTVQTGRFELQSRHSLPGGFGDSVVVKNADLLNIGHLSDFQMEEGEQHQWSPGEAAYVCGTPPCSGFSLMNASKKANKRGPDSPINSCMRDLVTFAGRCTGWDGKRGAEIVSFESVQQAFTTGRGLMQELREVLERTSGQKYDLTHVMMSGASIGASQARHRYYPVFHRIPFGVDRPEPRKVATYRDAIDDLRDLDMTWEDQPYLRAATDWSADRRRDDGLVSSHVTLEETARFSVILGEIVDDWQPGESMKDVIARQPAPPKHFLERFPYDETNWRDLRGWQWPRRIRGDKPGYVIAGGGIQKFVHYEEPRFLTVRELSRLMGYPDSWEWPDGVSVTVASSLIGKCCPVDSGRWVSEWVARAFDGEPGERGEPTSDELAADREYLHNSSLDYRRWDPQVSQWTHR